MGYVGIDVGKNGGIVSLDRDSNIQIIKTIPKIKTNVDYGGLFSIIQSLSFNSDDPKIIVCIEDVHSIFGSSAKANFSFGEIKGILIGMVVACGYRYEMVQPKKWQKEIWNTQDIVKKPNGRNDTKATSLLAAKRLFPNETFLATQRSKKPHDGLYDSALIAEYGRRIYSRS